jgi:glutamate synthase domain-containing protein 2
VVRGGFVMVFSCFLVMLGCFMMSFDCHVESSTWGVPRQASKHAANTAVDRSRRRFTVFTSGTNMGIFVPL